jgi:hypothetical protein
VQVAGLVVAEELGPRALGDHRQELAHRVVAELGLAAVAVDGLDELAVGVVAEGLVRRDVGAPGGEVLGLACECWQISLGAEGPAVGEAAQCVEAGLEAAASWELARELAAEEVDGVGDFAAVEPGEAPVAGGVALDFFDVAEACGSADALAVGVVGEVDGVGLACVGLLFADDLAEGVALEGEA